MKAHHARFTRVPLLLIGTATLLSTPALAQEAPAPQAAPPAAAVPDVAPPPVVSTAPAPAPAPAPTITMAPQSPIVQPVPEPAEAAPVAAAAPAPRAAARPSVASRAAPARPTIAAPSAPAETQATPSTSAATVTTAPSAAPAEATPAAPAASEATTATTTTTTRSSGTAWAIGIVAVLAVLGALFFLMRRRKDDDTAYVAETSHAPRHTVAPVAETSLAPAMLAPLPPTEINQPVFETAAQEAREERLNGHAPHVAQAHAAESAAVHEANEDDLAGITDADAPVARRPWLEFGIRPLRAGTSMREALVEVELIVGNAGDTPAEDVRISTFMLPADSSTEMERLLTQHSNEASVPPVDIAPGEGTRVDAILSVPRAELNGDETFSPLVVAEARYKLPDGSEGRTSAAFRVGVTDEEGDRFDPIGLDRPEIFHTVAAQLHGTPEHV